LQPLKVNRQRLTQLTDLPNIGQASASDLRLLGIHSPQDLIGRDLLAMYESLYALTGVRHDPCVADVFMSVTRFMDGQAPKAWWAFTPERKLLSGR
jgi:Pathogenicity locus